jgi:TetR/AcrR family transcriptional repressor of nem operon
VILLQNKKEQIISAAIQIIHHKGYRSAKLSDFLEAAQVGKGQFYHYFPSKRALGMAVVDHLLRDWDQQLIQGILQSDKDPADRLNDMLDWVVCFHRDTPGMRGCPFGNLALEMSEHDEEFCKKVNECFQRWIDSLKKTLEELRQQGRLPDSTDPQIQAESIVALIEGGILLMKSAQRLDILENIVETIRHRYHLNQVKE